MKIEEKEDDKIKESWDLRRVIVGLVLLIIFGAIGAYYLMGFIERSGLGLNKKTLGVSTQNENSAPPLPNKEDISKIITTARDELSQITSDNLTSSQAAIQKIIGDLQLLTGGKKSAADILCEFVCKK